MDVWTLVGGLAVIIGLVAGVVQILDYLQKRQEKKRQPLAEEVLAPSSPVPAVPHNLPSRGEFIGREKEKAWVREALASRWPLTCIDGIGGIGKTALALEVAGECLQASKGEISANDIPPFDGFIWTTAKDRELALNDVLDAIARTLDYLGIAQQPLEEKRESVRKLLQSKRHLLIVDNFETVTDEAVRDFLLRLPEPSKALITSREQRLRQAWAVSLKGMEQGEALTLIRSEGRRLGLASVEKGEKQVLLRLYKTTGGAPLAIKWAVGQIKQKGQSLDTVLAALHEARGDIFEEVFARSWSLLSDEARPILIVMPIYAASASRAAIEAASDVRHYALDEGLGQLVEMSLVEATDELDEAKRRYSIHPLTRAFAGAKLGEDKEFGRAAHLRAADYFLKLAEEFGGSTSRWHTYGKIEDELGNVLAVMAWCYGRMVEKTEEGSPKEVKELGKILTDFGWAMRNFFWARCYWSEGVDFFERVIHASELLQDWKSLGWRMHDMAWIYFQHRRDELTEVAKDWARKSLGVMESAGDRRGVGFVIQALGVIAMAGEGCDYDLAEKRLDEALEILKEHGKATDIPTVQLSLGILARKRGDFSTAERCFKEVLAAGNELGVARILPELGGISFEKGDLEKAEQYYHKGLALASKTGRKYVVALCEQGLAVIKTKQGDAERALQLARRALETYERLGLRKEIKETRALAKRLEGNLVSG